jgi:hypothetical protein
MIASLLERLLVGALRRAGCRSLRCCRVAAQRVVRWRGPQIGMPPRTAIPRSVLKQGQLQSR